MSSSTTQCTLSNKFGVTVQAALALMVLVVLCTEYIHEYFCNYKKRRKLLQFWFDTYKICAGALISHLFNMGVSKIIGGSSGTTNECAVYALAFYYEACGVPFVQLLQYGVIHYATAMSKQTQQTQKCANAWKSVSEPGLYPDTPSSGNDEYGVWECCRDLNLWVPKTTFIMVLLSAVAAGLAYCVAKLLLKTNTYVSGSFGMLAAIFMGTLYLAPHSSHWQVLNWVVVKAFEKTLWSAVAIAQESYFRAWASTMSTGNPQLDAWLFIAVIPIIMNAFMFFMFSRISRLKIPCMEVSRRHKLDEIEERNLVDLRVENNTTNPTTANTTNPTREIHMHGLSFTNEQFDISEAIKVGIVYTLFINTVLFVIAVAYLEAKLRNGMAALLLFATMIVFPVFASAAFIALFYWMITSSPPINICACCCCCGWYATAFAYDHVKSEDMHLAPYQRMDDGETPTKR